ncbi:hypothetical protein BD310DRAFT_834031, partial [Dichomitus squalens]
HTNGVQQLTGPTVQISLSFVALPDRDLQVFRFLRRAAFKESCDFRATLSGNLAERSVNKTTH